MSGDAHSDLDAAITEVDRVRALLGRIADRQVRRGEDRDYLKSVAFTWFRSRRASIAEVLTDDMLRPLDSSYQSILDATDKLSAKSTYLDAAKAAKADLVAARRAILVAAIAPPPRTPETTPDFSPLASDQTMRAILARRWNECQMCVAAGAPLAATVMMGGLLEALFVARANRLTDKSALVGAAAAPKDKTTGKALPYQQWMLAAYISVGHELQWISRSAKDVAVVLRDYRNYIHPEKERSHNVVLQIEDARNMWDVSKMLSRELLSMKGKT